MNTENLKNKLIKEFGGIPNLAKTLGITRQAIYMWRKKSHMPLVRALQIEKLTKSRFTVNQLLKIKFK